MKIQPGYLYHIKDEFFDIVQDKYLMQNKPHGGGRPTLLCQSKEKDLWWAIPMTSQIEKAKKLKAREEKRYGSSLKVEIGEYNGADAAFLLQNMYPVTESFIDHPHKMNNKTIPIRKDTYEQINRKIKRIVYLTNRGHKVTYTNIPKILNTLRENEQKRERRDLYNEPISDRYVAWMKEREKEQGKNKGKGKTLDYE